MLLQAGANVDAVGNRGETDLIAAAGNCHFAIVRLLLGAGASVDVQGNHGNTARCMAAERGHAQIVELIKRAQTD